MAVICLLVGLAVGYLLRGSATDQVAVTSPAAQASAGAGIGSNMQVTPEQLKHMADKQAEPMLQQLKARPNDPTLLANLGNLYYDAQQFQDAVSHYERSLKLNPLNTNVRTDLGTAYWYLGDADRAIQEFQTALKTEPNKPNTLMNLGIVQWRGKLDAKAAVAAWQKLLATNPGFEGRSQVEQLITEAKRHGDIKPGTKTDKPAM
ncbi:MAG: tetratricopeptide repeat protein [Terriglobales bacterium]